MLCPHCTYSSALFVLLCRSQLLARPLQLALLPNETFDACERPAEDCGAPVLVADGGTMAMLVSQVLALPGQ